MSTACSLVLQCHLKLSFRQNRSAAPSHRVSHTRRSPCCAALLHRPVRSGSPSQVLIGGGENHRMGLYDMVMVKDNHIAAAGGIEAAVQRTQAYLQERGLDVPVEVMEGGGGGREDVHREVRSREEGAVGEGGGY